MNQTMKISMGLLLGAAVGLVFNSVGIETPWVKSLTGGLFTPIYTVFLRGLFMVVVPLVFCYIVIGITNLKSGKNLSKIGGRLALYYGLTSICALIIGHVLVLWIEPGSVISSDVVQQAQQSFSEQVSGLQNKSLNVNQSLWPGIVEVIVPKNILSALSTNNLLATIFLAIFSGCCIIYMGNEQKNTFLKICESLGELTSKMIHFIMKLAPLAIFCLMAVAMATLGVDLIKGVLLYMAVVLLGLGLHFLGVYSLMLKYLVKVPIIPFYKKMTPVFVTAFSTSSSMATMPTTIDTLEKNFKVSKKVSSLSIPIGTTVNMDGTSLFEIVAALFIAQVFGVELTLGTHLIFIALIFLTAVGAAGVPGGSIPILMSAMAAVGIPPEGIAIILGVDRLLDMARTTVNVTGDTIGALYLSKDKEIQDLVKE